MDDSFIYHVFIKGRLGSLQVPVLSSEVEQEYLAFMSLPIPWSRHQISSTLIMSNEIPTLVKLWGTCCHAVRSHVEEHLSGKCAQWREGSTEEIWRTSWLAGQSWQGGKEESESEKVQHVWIFEWPQINGVEAWIAWLGLQDPVCWSVPSLWSP